MPIKRLWNNQESLNNVIDFEDWDEAERISKLIVSDIKEALDFDKCKTGTPTLDGIYGVGTIRYTKAPKNVRKSIDKMNRIIKTAKDNVPKRPPKK